MISAVVVHEPRHCSQRRLPRFASLHFFHGGVPFERILQYDFSCVCSVKDVFELFGDLKVHRVPFLVFPRGVHVAHADAVLLFPFFGGHFAVEQRVGQVWKVYIGASDAHGDLVVGWNVVYSSEAAGVPFFGQFVKPSRVVVGVFELISFFEHEDVFCFYVVAVQAYGCRHAAPHDGKVGEVVESFQFHPLPLVQNAVGRLR